MKKLLGFILSLVLFIPFAYGDIVNPVPSGGGGGVSSVGLAETSGLFGVSGSPVTSSGTLTLTPATQAAGAGIYAAPVTSTSSGAPSFRKIAAGDFSSGAIQASDIQGGGTGVGLGSLPVWTGNGVACNFNGAGQPLYYCNMGQLAAFLGINAAPYTNAMLSNMPASTVKCNATAGAAAPADCTSATMQGLLGYVTAPVANTSLATMAASTIKCNATGGVAAPTDCTAATVNTLLGGGSSHLKASAAFHWDGSAMVLDQSFNVASVGRTGVGAYTVTYSAAMLTATYAVFTRAIPLTANPTTFSFCNDNARLTGSYTLLCYDGTSTPQDLPEIYVQVLE